MAGLREINQKMKLVILEVKRGQIAFRLAAEKIYAGGGICC